PHRAGGRRHARLRLRSDRERPHPDRGHPVARGGPRDLRRHAAATAADDGRVRETAVTLTGRSIDRTPLATRPAGAPFAGAERGSAPLPRLASRTRRSPSSRRAETAGPALAPCDVAFAALLGADRGGGERRSITSAR